METVLPEVKIIEPAIFADERGSMHVNEFSTMKPPYVPLQVNTTRSYKKGTLRGLHYQEKPYEQAKYVICLVGSVISVAVDIRKGSTTFGNYTKVILSAKNGKAMLIPRGFAQGYLTLEDNCLLQYFLDNEFSPGHAGCIRFDDPDVAIDWGTSGLANTDFIISEKDRNGIFLKDL